MTGLEGVFDELTWFLRAVVIRWLLKDIHQVIIICIVGCHLSADELATQAVD